jgi:FAD/FMN-containing dehydrogenase
VATTHEAGRDVGELERPAGFAGALIAPADAGYEEARRVYNGMIDRRPALIARCADVADVIAIVDHARQTGSTLAVRGGAHNAGGLGVWDDAVVCDLSAMRGVRVDAATGRVRVAGGATLGELDHATHVYGLAVPAGIVGTTGVAGLTLGGGLGYLTRRFGLGIDSLLSADVVLADGTVVTADESEHPDLFWALRGGGGNFGVVTSFEFQGRPVHTIVGGPTLYPIERAAEVMRWWDELLAGSSDDLNGFFAFVVVPPGPPFPAELHLEPMCGVVWCWTGPGEAAEEALAPVRAFGPPAFDGVGELPFPALNGAFDALYPPGLQWYWKADFVDELSEAAIAIHADFGARLPSAQSTMHLYPIDRAGARPASHDTAWAYRGSRYAQVIVGVDPDPATVPELVGWTRAYHDALHPHSAGGGYVNMLMHDEGPERVRASYRGNYERLAEVKRRYDPHNLFHVNQNIVP